MVTIEPGDEEGTINIKSEFFPEIDMKNEENNNNAVVKAGLTVLEAIKNLGK